MVGIMNVNLKHNENLFCLLNLQMFTFQQHRSHNTAIFLHKHFSEVDIEYTYDTVIVLDFLKFYCFSRQCCVTYFKIKST